MILQALYEYYQKHPDLPRPGFQNQEIKFVIVIGQDGGFLELEDRRVDAKKKNGTFFLLPQGAGRSGKNSWQNPYLLWDHYGYVLCHPKPGKNEVETAKNQESARLQHGAFVERLQNLPDEVKQDPGVAAVLAFYRSGGAEAVKSHPDFAECAKIPGCNLTFRLQGETRLIAQRPAVEAYVASQASGADDSSDTATGRCLITGSRGPLTRLMGATAIPGAKSTASLVSFQTNSGYDSYGKEQCFNAPMSEEASFACATVLKYMLQKGSRNSMTIGDITYLYWQEKYVGDCDVTEIFPELFRGSKDDADHAEATIGRMLKAVWSGRLPYDPDNSFYLLGLSPNSGRISVRFFRTGLVAELAKKIDRHYRDLEIVRGPKDAPYLTMSSLLSSTALEYKMENVSHNLQAKMAEAILDGTAYPATFQGDLLRRLRADHNVTRTRAAGLKAYLSRKNRNHHEKEIIMSLDKENCNIGYLCGRLFAVLEKCQNEANPGLNATIRDRYFASASATPRVALGRLLSLNVHHLSKLSEGRNVTMTMLLGEIIGKLADFPATLAMEDQARFAIGYYHQRQDLFTAKNDKNKEEK